MDLYDLLHALYCLMHAAYAAMLAAAFDVVTCMCQLSATFAHPVRKLHVAKIL